MRWRSLLVFLAFVWQTVSHDPECDQDFERAEEMRLVSIEQGRDRDPENQAAVFEGYRKALACNPDHGDAWIRLVYLSSNASDRSILSQAPPSFVASHFDGLAGSFDDLMQSIEYRAATSLASLVHESHFSEREEGDGWGKVHESHFAEPLKVLDLGCGSGLLAEALASRLLRFSKLEGVDISPKMLQKARDRGLYSSLVESDILRFVTNTPDSPLDRFDLMAMTDVSGYLGGSLIKVVSAATQWLAPQGLLALTLELPQGHEEESAAAESAAAAHGDGDGGWVLPRRSLRFAHDLDLFLAACLDSGFEVEALKHEVLRVDSGAAVRGALLVLRLSPLS